MGVFKKIKAALMKKRSKEEALKLCLVLLVVTIILSGVGTHIIKALLSSAMGGMNV